MRSEISAVRWTTMYSSLKLRVVFLEEIMIVDPCGSCHSVILNSLGLSDAYMRQ